MKKFIQILTVALLAIASIGCSNSNDGLDYLKGTAQLWQGSVDSLDMSCYGPNLSVIQGNPNIVKTTVDSTTLVLEGVNTGLTTLFITTDQVFIEMLVRVRSLVGYWGVTTNQNYGIEVAVESDGTVGTDSIALIQTGLVEQYSALLAGSNFEFGPTLFVWSNGTNVADGSWQLSNSSLVLTENGIARTILFEVYTVDRVGLTANILEKAQSLYPNAGLTSATLTFYLDRRTAM